MEGKFQVHYTSNVKMQCKLETPQGQAWLAPKTFHHDIFLCIAKESLLHKPHEQNLPKHYINLYHNKQTTETKKKKKLKVIAEGNEINEAYI